LVIYAELLNAKGDTSRAREVAAEAVAMFREMDMQWDLDRMEGLA
jgi:hypothetical protein